MKKLLIITILMAFGSLSYGQYVNHYQGMYDFNEYAKNKCLTNAINNDGYVTVPYGFNGDSVFFGLLKVDNNFNIVWDKLYNSTSNLYYSSYTFYANDMAKDTANNRYIVCWKLDYYSTPSFISLFDSSGNFIWMQKYYDIRNINAIIPIINDTTISYAACGESEDGKAIVIGIDNSGNVIWAQKETSDDATEYTDLAQVADGDIMVIGNNKGEANKAMLTRLTTAGTPIYNRYYIASESSTYRFNAISYENFYNYGYNYPYATLYITGSFGEEDYSDVLLTKSHYYGGLADYSKYYNIGNSSIKEKGNDIYLLSDSNEIAITGETYVTDFGLADTNGFILQLDTFGNVNVSTIFGDTYENRLSKIVRSNNGHDYVMSGYLIDNRNESLYLVEDYDYIQEECRSHDIDVSPTNVKVTYGSFSLDTITISSSSEYLFQVNVDYDYQALCEKNSIYNKRLPNQNTESQLNEIIIEPTVTTNSINIISNQNMTNIQIYSTSGQLVYSINNLSELNTTLNVSDLAKGIYFVRIKTANDTVIKKFIKQ